MLHLTGADNGTHLAKRCRTISVIGVFNPMVPDTTAQRITSEEGLLLGLDPAVLDY